MTNRFLPQIQQLQSGNVELVAKNTELEQRISSYEQRVNQLQVDAKNQCDAQLNARQVLFDSLKQNLINSHAQQIRQLQKENVELANANNVLTTSSQALSTCQANLDEVSKQLAAANKTLSAQAQAVDQLKRDLNNKSSELVAFTKRAQDMEKEMFSRQKSASDATIANLTLENRTLKTRLTEATQATSVLNDTLEKIKFDLGAEITRYKQLLQTSNSAKNNCDAARQTLEDEKSAFRKTLELAEQKVRSVERQKVDQLLQETKDLKTQQTQLQSKYSDAQQEIDQTRKKMRALVEENEKSNVAFAKSQEAIEKRASELSSRWTQSQKTNNLVQEILDEVAKQGKEEEPGLQQLAQNFRGGTQEMTMAIENLNGTVLNNTNIVLVPTASTASSLQRATSSKFGGSSNAR